MFCSCVINMKVKTILILGGGIGGIVVANTLRKLIPNEHKIILIEKNRIHSFAPSYLWLMIGDRKPEKICTDISKLLLPNIELVNAEANALLLKDNKIQTTLGSYSYNYLIIALGAEIVPEAIPGLNDDYHTYFTFDGAQKLFNTLSQFKRGKIALVICSLPYKCPAAPYEGAMLIANFFRRKGIKNNVQINIYTPEPLPMPVAGSALGEAVRKVLQSRAIGFFPLYKLKTVNSSKKELYFEGKESIPYDLLVAIPPHTSPKVIRSSGLAAGTGWVPANLATLQTKIENVYALGDVTGIQIPGRWKPDVPMMLPKAGIFAHLQAEIVAKRIADEIKGRSPKDEFCGDGFCMLEAGEHLAAFAYGNFYREPSPDVRLRKVGKIWHLGKVLFEKWWLSPIGLKRSLLHQSITIGRKIMRIPVNI